MEHRLGRKKYKIFAFDIESHNDEESIEKKETSIWLGAFIDEKSKVDDEKSYVYNMDEFLARIEAESNPVRHHNEKIPVKNVCIYVYNFSFEWSFILPYLYKHNFKYKEKIEDNDEFVFNSVSTKTCSSVWCAQLKFSKKSGLVVFRDMAKIYGGGLGKVAKAFNLETQKGEIDYRKNRLHNYVITKEEKEYCFNDTRILVDILIKMIEKNDKEFFNAVSMATYATKKMIKVGWPRSIKPMKEYRKSYPELSEEETNFLRRGVSGGITYAPSRWQFKEINQKILHIDAHQMHPSQGYLKYFPYGKGEYFTGKPPIGKISACRIRVSYDDVRLHSIIPLIGYDFVEGKELVVWNFEIPTMKKVYVNLDIEYIDGYAYNSRPLPWRKFYAENYDERLKARKKKDDFNVLYYKLLNNSSYGKLLEKPHNQLFANIINQDGVIDSQVLEKGIEDLEINAKYTYLPVGSAIPAYSRVCLIETAIKLSPEYTDKKGIHHDLGEKILYFDTDSIFCLLDSETRYIWECEISHVDYLGGWALEEIIDRAQFTAPKRYKIEVAGKTTIKAGGINFRQYKTEKVDDIITKEAKVVSDEERREMIDKYEIPYDEINIVSSSFNVQRAFRCKGGTIIVFQKKEMAIQKKYKDIAKNNIENYDEIS